MVDVTEDDSNEQYHVEQDESDEHENKNNASNTSYTGKNLCAYMLWCSQ